MAPSRGPNERPAAGGRADHVTPEDAPRLCSDCRRPLSVAERMFYFLEGAGATPFCRLCLGRVASADSRGSTKAVPPPPADLSDAVRSLLEEEFRRIDDVLRQMDRDDPDTSLLQEVRDAGQHDLSRGLLADGVVSLTDARRILAARGGNGGLHSPLSAPWDESTEELFDRVAARARAMAHRSAAASPEEDLPESLPMRPRLSGPAKVAKAST